CEVEYEEQTPAVTVRGPGGHDTGGAEATQGTGGTGADGGEEPARRALAGGTFDLNAIPDALPALAATACYAAEPVELGNVPQARAKETDRVAVMAAELGKMGAHIEELEDGLRVYPPRARGQTTGDRAAAQGGTPSHPATPLTGTRVDGHGDHRVVMALAVAALGAAGETTIEGAEAAAITFPGFFEALAALGAEVTDEAGAAR
ncbi:MAG: hypothetical protein ACLFUX_05800, partial [Spirochaetaceae bacterium]